VSVSRFESTNIYKSLRQLTGGKFYIILKVSSNYC
jgi:hypothetical protein